MMYVSINSLTSHRKALLGLSGCSTIQQATTKVSIGLGCKAGLLVTLIYCNVGVQLPRGGGGVGRRRSRALPELLVCCLVSLRFQRLDVFVCAARAARHVVDIRVNQLCNVHINVLLWVYTLDEIKTQT